MSEAAAAQARAGQPKLTLIGDPLCPYSQRTAIALAEKGVRLERRYSASADGSCAGMPVLRVGDDQLLEPEAMLGYLEVTLQGVLCPSDPVRRGEHSFWIEFGSSVLEDLEGFCAARDAQAFAVGVDGLRQKFGELEKRTATPFFDGLRFSLVDATFAPVFRFFEVFDRIADFGILSDRPKIDAWRKALMQRPSVQRAVTCDYPARLWSRLAALRSHLSALMPGPEALLKRC